MGPNGPPPLCFRLSGVGEAASPAAMADPTPDTPPSKKLGNLAMIWRHAIPNLLRAPLVYSMSDVVLNIVWVASLSFLGLGVQPPTPDLGSMVADGAKYLPDSWWLTVFPGLAILVAVFGFNLVGDALREILGADQ